MECTYTCVPITSPKEKYHTSRSSNVFTTQQLYGTLIHMTSRITQHEPTTIFNWLALFSLYIFKTVSLNLSRVHQTPSSASTNWMHTPYASLTIFSPEDQLFIEITILHLYVKSNSPPLLEVQSASWDPKQLHMGCITKCGCAFTAAYVPYPKIKPIVVHLNELYQA